VQNTSKVTRLSPALHYNLQTKQLTHCQGPCQLHAMLPEVTSPYQVLNQSPLVMAWPMNCID